MPQPAIIASILLSAIALAATLYILAFALRGISLGLRPSAVAVHPATRFLVMVPAYNEGEGITETIRSLQACDYPKQLLTIVAIADNCTDDTAAIAAAAGAEVWERNDLTARGKGQAMQWALERARTREFDLAAVIDADTVIAPSFFSEIAVAAEADAAASVAAVYQGRYTFLATRDDAPWFETFSLASKAAENTFIHRPRAEAGLFNLLQGNGICLSQAALARVPFRASSVVEDAEYAIALALEGVPVRFVENAQVYSRMTSKVSDASSQRLRWASGTFQLIVRSVPKLIAGAARKGSWRLLEAAVMLLTTSRVLIVGLTAAAAGFAVIVAWRGGGAASLMIAAAAILLQSCYLVLMFRKADAVAYPLRRLVWMPFYVVFISAMQAVALTGLRRKRWSRTVR